MRVWIDLSNSPHPLLFEPVARRMAELGHTTILTARDNAQTVELARQRWPEVTVIGGSTPRGRVNKARTIARRVRALARWARAAAPDVALSHNSYAQAAAARLLRIPVVTAMDFEYQPANHLAFRLAHRILLPAPLDQAVVRGQGASPAKTIRYPGLKEELYLGDFEPDPTVLEKLGLSRTSMRRLVVARTPPDRALYHRFENSIFFDALHHVAAEDGTRCVILTRDAEQRSVIERQGIPNVVAPTTAIDSRALMYEADLVLGAGGTMTREAALLGVPTFSLFAGRAPAVDEWLVERGLLKRLEDVEQLDGALDQPSPRRTIADLKASSEPVVELFAQTTLELAGSKDSRSARR